MSKLYECKQINVTTKFQSEKRIWKKFVNDKTDRCAMTDGGINSIWVNILTSMCYNITMT